jgi:hypothetical protein
MKRITGKLMKCLHCPVEMMVSEDATRMICAPCLLAGRTFPRDVQTEFTDLETADQTLQPEAA